MRTLIPAKILAAALHCAATYDVRYYLIGVFIEVRAGHCRAVATDGAVVGVFRYPGLLTEDAPVDVIIPRSTVEMALKFKTPALELVLDDKAWSLAGIPFTPQDGKYPEHRRVVNAQPTGEASYFDPELLMRMVKVGKALGLKSGPPIVRQSGPSPALVHFHGCDDFTGVVMPYRLFNDKQPDIGWPTWAAS